MTTIQCGRCLAVISGPINSHKCERDDYLPGDADKAIQRRDSWGVIDLENEDEMDYLKIAEECGAGVMPGFSNAVLVDEGILARFAERVRGVPEGFVWPEPPPRKGQSPVLFDDGYAEGWAKCINTIKTMLAAAPCPPQRQAGESSDGLGTMQIYAQASHHHEARIVGDRHALEALRNAITRALEHGEAFIETFAADGEGYELLVQLKDDKAQRDMPGHYTDFLERPFDITDRTSIAAPSAPAVSEQAAEIERLKADYLRACKTVAEMHAAATDGYGGPKRGVVEDIADLKQERDGLREALISVQRYLRTGNATSAYNLTFVALAETTKAEPQEGGVL